jgi:hypothetical protein
METPIKPVLLATIDNANLAGLALQISGIKATRIRPSADKRTKPALQDRHEARVDFEPRKQIAGVDNT